MGYEPFYIHQINFWRWFEQWYVPKGYEVLARLQQETDGRLAAIAQPPVWVPDLIPSRSEGTQTGEEPLPEMAALLGLVKHFFPKPEWDSYLVRRRIGEQGLRTEYVPPDRRGHIWAWCRVCGHKEEFWEHDYSRPDRNGKRWRIEYFRRRSPRPVGGGNLVSYRVEPLCSKRCRLRRQMEDI